MRRGRVLTRLAIERSRRVMKWPVKPNAPVTTCSGPVSTSNARPRRRRPINPAAGAWEPRLCLSASRHGRHDGHLGSILEGGQEPGEEPDVLLVDEDVDELEHFAPVIQDLRPDAWKPAVEVDERLRQVAPADGHHPFPVRDPPKRGGNAHGDGHQPPASASTRSSNDASVGLMVTEGSTTSSTASSAFRPIPVMYATVTSSGPIAREAASLRRTPIVTPPAGSVKRPSVWASSRTASTTSPSVTDSTAPPVLRARSRT